MLGETSVRKTYIISCSNLKKTCHFTLRMTGPLLDLKQVLQESRDSAEDGPALEKYIYGT